MIAATDPSNFWCPIILITKKMISIFAAFSCIDKGKAYILIFILAFRPIYIFLIVIHLYTTYTKFFCNKNLYLLHKFLRKNIVI
ncbi:hypothetical protein BTJ40_06950 [Microbulbifer sp. A4B17]|nr:hypothetical protein BTJ40_06950 [Microbulbifer sp. A4B17]